MQDSGAGGGGDVVRLINQARSSMKSRDYEAAKAGFKSIYDFLSRRGLGEGLEAMECLADLGATHMALKEYDAALSEYAKLASIMERNLGEANAELRQHLRRYAQACDVAGKLNEAKQLYSRANDLERRYGAVPARSTGGSLPGRFQSGTPTAQAPEPAAGGGSTFAEAIQDAVARSMAKLDNRGKPFEPASSGQPPKSAAPGPRPFISSPLPPSPFQNLVSEVTKPQDNPGADNPASAQSQAQSYQGLPQQGLQQGQQGQQGLQQGQQGLQQGQQAQQGQQQASSQQVPPQPQPMPQGFTGSPATPGQDAAAIPSFKVPKELSDSQFIYQPKGNSVRQTGDQSNTQTGEGQPGPGGMKVSGGLPVAPTPQAKADPEAVQRAIAEHAAAKQVAAQQAAQQAATDFSSGWSDSAQNDLSQPVEEEPPALVQEPEVPWADTQGVPEEPGVGQSGSHWRGPRSGTASGDLSSISQERPIIEEGNFEPISGARPSNYQSVEESLDKVFGQSAGPEQARGSSIYAEQHDEQVGGPGISQVGGEAGNSPVRRTNPSLNSSKLRQMQNRGNVPEPRPGLREDVEPPTPADSYSTVAPLGYDPADYDPSVPTHPWAAPGQGSPPSDPGDSRRPGAKRATAEWQVDPADGVSQSEVDIADPHHTAEVHPDSDASKAMAQWGVTINDQPEEHYPPIRQDDRRQGLQPHEEETPPGVPKPFDRRQRPKSMKNLRSRFGDMEPSTNVDDSEFEESEVMNQQPQGASGAPSFAPPGTPGSNMQPPSGGESRSLPPQTPPRRLADNSITSMTPPELPPDQMLTQQPPEMPPPPPPVRGRGARGLLERTGAYGDDDAQQQFDPQADQNQNAPFAEEPHEDSRPSSMISRLVSKRQHDTSMQNAKPSFSSDELQVPPRIRSMVDTARANISDGRHADAARLMQKVVNDLAEGGLKDSRYVADCMLILSEAYEASGQLGPAITSFHQHALMVEKRVGVKDYESIGNWYRLAVLLDKANERDDARTMFEHALGLAAQHLDADDELTAAIKASYEEFLTNPEKPSKKPAPTQEYSKEEVLAQNKELRTSAHQQQDKPRNKGVVIWSTVSVIVLVAAGFWFFSLMGSMNKSIGNIDATATGGAIPEQIFANTDGDGLLRFTGTENLEVTVDGKLRQVRYKVLKNDLSDLATMFMNAGVKQSIWIRKAPDGMLVDDNTMFFHKDAPELAMANEMRRIGQRVEEYYQLNRSYPRFRQDWSEDPAFGFINPTTHKGEATVFHVFPKSATQAALFGGFSTPDEIANYLESGNTWVGEPELKPCSISVAVKHSGEKSNGKPIVQEFYMHATDQNNQYLPASKPKTVSVVLLTQGRNIGNFDLHPLDLKKVELVPMPDGIAYVNMSETPLFGSDILKSVVPVTFIGLAALFFFGLLITVATLRSNKKNTNKK